MKMTRTEFIDRFLAISYLYFQLADNNSNEVSAIEIEEWVEIINAGNEPMMCPDQHVA